MNCIFCNRPAGFLKKYHEDCFSKTQIIMQQIQEMINQYNRDSISALEAKQQIVELASSDIRHENYLLNEIIDKSKICSNDILIHSEKMVSIWESKNRCTMKRTGLSYARYPEWSESNQLLCNLGTVVFSDKSIYLILDEKTIAYPYKKIIDFGYTEDSKYTYFDVKTASPYPHRFFIRAFDKKDKSSAQNVCIFLKCLSGQ